MIASIFNLRAPHTPNQSRRQVLEGHDLGSILFGGFQQFRYAQQGAGPLPVVPRNAKPVDLRYCVTQGRIGPSPNPRTRSAPAACVEARMWSPSIFATILWGNRWMFSYYVVIKIKSVYSFYS